MYVRSLARASYTKKNHFCLASYFAGWRARCKYGWNEMGVVAYIDLSVFLSFFVRNQFIHQS